jgi:indolepyruvate ferredoxin oxidoreductase beta subunit
MVRIVRNTTGITNIAITGVGGQGVLTLAEVLAKAATSAGQNVRVGEIHGMAQRGGHVLCTIRIGEYARGPIIDSGTAQLLAGFEPVETLREVQLVAPGGCVIMSSRALMPVAVSMDQAKYPDHDDIIDSIRKFTAEVIEFDAMELAEKAGSPNSLNMVMLGAMIGTELVPVTKDSALESLRDTIPRQFQEVNSTAFNLGLAQMRQILRK